MIKIFLLLILYYIFYIRNKSNKKNIIRIFLFIIILFFYTMCIKYTKQSYYTIDDTENFSKIRIADFPIELKELYFLGDILYFEILKKNNLVLDKIEIFYEDKKIGIIEIRKNIDDMEDLDINYIKRNRSYKKIYSLEQELLRILGKNDERIGIGLGYYRLFRLDIYIKDSKLNKVYVIKKSVKISFEEKGFKLFIPSV